MKRFIEGEDRQQINLLPESLDDYIGVDNPIRAFDVFVYVLDLRALGFGVVPAVTGRPSCHPAALLKIYLYGCLNRIQTSRRLERETQRNVALMWLTGRLSPDFKTIADFRRDNVVTESGAHFGWRCGLKIQSALDLGQAKPNALTEHDFCAYDCYRNRSI